MGKLSYSFSNGLILDDNRIYDQKLQGTATNNTLCFGTIASTYLELTLDNNDYFFDNYSFKNCYINVYDDNVKKMKLYIDSAKINNNLLTIKAYDKLLDLDKTWIPCKTPITLYNFISDICNQVGINMFAFNLINAGYRIHNIDELKGKTCRECLSYALELCGTYAYLNSNEQLTFKWFDFNKVRDIDISNLIDYSSDYELSTIDNVYFVRGSKVYSSKKKPKGSIFLTKDNPLLKEASSKKVNSIIKNLSTHIGFSYLPCNISTIDFFTYNIGDVVSFTDERGNVRNALVCTVEYSGYNSCNITSVNVDEKDITTNETDNSSNSSTSSSGSFSFYRKMNNSDIEYKECSENTQIQYFLNFNIEDAFDTIQAIVNNKPYKYFNVHNGNNTIALMIKGDLITDSTTSIDIVTDNVLNDIELDTIYSDCLVIEYDEEDENIEIGEKEISIPDGYFFRDLSSLYYNTAIMGWRYSANSNVEALYYLEGEGHLTNNDNDYSPEIYTTKMKDLYKDLRDSKHYIRIGLNGSITDYDKTIYNYNNSGLELKNHLIYKKKHKNESDSKFKYYASTNGIIEVMDGDVIQFGFLCKSGHEPNFSQFDNLEVIVSNLDENITCAKCDYLFYVDTFDWENSTLKVMRPIFNNSVSSNPDLFYNNHFLGDYYDNSNIVKFNDDNSITFNLGERGGRSIFAYREYTTKGYKNVKSTS